MQLIPATFVQMAPAFGQSIKRNTDATEVAAAWLWGTHIQKYKHSQLLVQSCCVPALTPIGVKRIDEMLYRESETGFMSGNVSSNVQSSIILPAYSQVEVNGFTKLDRLGNSVTNLQRDAVGELDDIPPGFLQHKNWRAMYDSPWCSAQDRAVLNDFKSVLQPKAGMVAPDEAVTVVRVMHMRDKQTRHDQPSPVITHGWLLIGNRGELHRQCCLNQTAVDLAMMARAKMALTYERYECADLLRIEGGKTVLVHEQVLQRLQAQGRDTAALDLSQARIASDETCEAAQAADSAPAP